MNRRQLGLWLGPEENRQAVAQYDCAPMTIAEDSLTFSALGIHIHCRRLLRRSTWLYLNGRVLPRSSDLLVDLVEVGLAGENCLLELVWSDDVSDHLWSAPKPERFVLADGDRQSAIYLVDCQGDGMHYWLDMLVGLGYCWSLAVPGESLSDITGLTDGELRDVLRRSAACFTEHDGELLDFRIRDETVARRTLHRFEEVARRHGFQVIEGP